MYCISCKKQIPDDAVFCQWCGKKQNKQSVSYHRRGNGLGSVYKSPAGTWTAERTLGFCVENGRKKRKKQRKYGFATKKDALKYLEAFENVPESVTMSELYERLQPELQELSYSKRGAYRIAWEKIKPLLAHRCIADLTSDEVQKASEVGAAYYPRRDIKILISKLYKLAMRDDTSLVNKAKYIRLPQHTAAERLTLTDKQIKTLWDDYKANPCVVVAAALIMLYTGMRTEEVTMLNPDNIHLKEHYLTGGIKTEKGKNRKIIIPDKIVPVLKWFLDADKPSWHNYLAEQWQVKRAALGFPEQITLYCCRHTYITKLTALNASPAMLQELAGHEDYETTLNYTHLSIADRLAIVNKL